MTCNIFHSNSWRRQNLFLQHPSASSDLLQIMDLWYKWSALLSYLCRGESLSCHASQQQLFSFAVGSRWGSQATNEEVEVCAAEFQSRAVICKKAPMFSWPISPYDLLFLKRVRILQVSFQVAGTTEIEFSVETFV